MYIWGGLPSTPKIRDSQTHRKVVLARVLVGTVLDNFHFMQEQLPGAITRVLGAPSDTSQYCLD
jgi:hypothetical protein